MHKRIRELREHLKLSQTAFADKLGMTRSMISNMELGLVEIQDYRIKAIVNTFNVSREWLETGEGEMFVQHADDGQAIAARVAKEYGSDPLLRAFMTTYLQLDEAKRNLLLKIVEGFSAALAEALASGEPAPDVSEYIRSRVLPPADESQSS